MSDSRIANRYAKSILELAVEQNDLDTVAADFAYLKSAFDSRDLFNLVKSPIINKGKKLDIFSKLFSDKLSKLTRLFLERVVRKGRESVIPEMVQAFEAQYNHRMAITAVKLTTLSSVAPETLESIKSKIRSVVGDAKQIVLEIEYDDSLIGGYIFEYEDKRYDASVRNNLDNIRQKFSA